MRNSDDFSCKKHGVLIHLFPKKKDDRPDPPPPPAPVRMMRVVDGEMVVVAEISADEHRRQFGRPRRRRAA